jgi:hypothetical protein
MRGCTVQGLARVSLAAVQLACVMCADASARRRR